MTKGIPLCRAFFQIRVSWYQCLTVVFGAFGGASRIDYELISTFDDRTPTAESTWRTLHVRALSTAPTLNNPAANSALGVANTRGRHLALLSALDARFTPADTRHGAHLCILHVQSAAHVAANKPTFTPRATPLGSPITNAARQRCWTFRLLRSTPRSSSPQLTGACPPTLYTSSDNFRDTCQMTGLYCHF